MRPACPVSLPPLVNVARLLPDEAVGARRSSSESCSPRALLSLSLAEKGHVAEESSSATLCDYDGQKELEARRDGWITATQWKLFFSCRGYDSRAEQAPYRRHQLQTDGAVSGIRCGYDPQARGVHRVVQALRSPHRTDPLTSSSNPGEVLDLQIGSDDDDVLDEVKSRTSSAKPEAPRPHSLTAACAAPPLDAPSEAVPTSQLEDHDSTGAASSSLERQARRAGSDRLGYPDLRDKLNLLGCRRRRKPQRQRSCSYSDLRTKLSDNRARGEHDSDDERRAPTASSGRRRASFTSGGSKTGHAGRINARQGIALRRKAYVDLDRPAEEDAEKRHVAKENSPATLCDYDGQKELEARRDGWTTATKWNLFFSCRGYDPQAERPPHRNHQLQVYGAVSGTPCGYDPQASGVHRAIQTPRSPHRTDPLTRSTGGRTSTQRRRAQRRVIGSSDDEMTSVDSISSNPGDVIDLEMGSDDHDVLGEVKSRTPSAKPAAPRPHSLTAACAAPPLDAPSEAVPTSHLEDHDSTGGASSSLERQAREAGSDRLGYSDLRDKLKLLRCRRRRKPQRQRSRFHGDLRTKLSDSRARREQDSDEERRAPTTSSGRRRAAFTSGYSEAGHAGRRNARQGMARRRKAYVDLDRPAEEDVGDVDGAGPFHDLTASYYRRAHI
ncbi:uncharacterized protein LOC125944976 [Dermacentor silvarum]|uniref:uncharacterized protein LOC125944976 n=1 Tax=Dermacentor silvarum TaxID=543639 RepID=UPI002101CC23|nr:uncharacterized protein LOC125944976 [Dermacentor silvarum]